MLEAESGLTMTGKTVHHLQAEDLVVGIKTVKIEIPLGAGAANAERRIREAIMPPRRMRQRKALERMPNGLRTLAEGAAKLGFSLKTLRGHMASGALRYVVVGHGKKRQRKMLTDADLDAFIANQTRKDSPACPSTEPRARHTGSSIFSGEVIGFTARRSARLAVKRKR
jgi:hypothetical protein